MIVAILFRNSSRIFSSVSKRQFNFVANLQIKNLQNRLNISSSDPFLSLKCSSRLYSSNTKTDVDKNLTPKVESVAQDSSVAKVSQRIRLKQAIRDYGATIIVFHIAIALTSLGISYIAISNGVDAVRLLTYIGFSETVISSKVAVGGSTFVIAYAVHKLFAPVRMGITLSVAPFIVRYLRRINWLKPPKSKI